MGSTIVKTQTDYYYENIDHLQLTRTDEKIFNDDLITTNKKYYPHDLPNEPYVNELIQQHRIGEVMREDNLVNSQQVSSSLVTYKDWSRSFIHPEYIESSTFNNPYDVKARFWGINTENGNPLEFSKEYDIHTSIVWGYQETKPVVKGENISYSDLSSAVSQTNPDLETLLSPNGIGDLTSQAQRDAWKEFNNTLRSQPLVQNSIITTYTYKSLVGITSETDPAGITIYYEYDDYGRLKFIRDNNYSIVKTYDYHYKEVN